MLTVRLSCGHWGLGVEKLKLTPKLKSHEVIDPDSFLSDHVTKWMFLLEEAGEIENSAHFRSHSNHFQRVPREALLESLSASIATAEPSWSSVQWWSKQFVALQDWPGVAKHCRAKWLSSHLVIDE